MSVFDSIGDQVNHDLSKSAVIYESKVRDIISSIQLEIQLLILSLESMHADYFSDQLYNVSRRRAQFKFWGFNFGYVQEISNMRYYEFSTMRSYLKHVTNILIFLYFLCLFHIVNTADHGS